jgi:hypothetical protein
MEMKSGDLNPLTLVTQKKLRDMEHEPTLLKGHDMTRYAYHKPFTVKFPDKCACSLKPDITGGLVKYKDRPKTKKGTGAWVYRWGLRRGHSFNLRLHTTVFQPEKYVIRAHIRENMKIGHTGRISYST